VRTGDPAVAALSELAGVVRRARRPIGWVARGPAPRGPAGDADLHPRAGEDLCYLAGDWRILQRLDGHRWSLDDLVTAHYAVRAADAFTTGAPERFADMGCGIGTVLLLLAWRFPLALGVGVEAQELSVALARRSARWNGAEGRVEIRSGDLRDPGSWPEGTAFDLVTGTPPYLPPGTASESSRAQRGPCRIEHRGGIEDYCLAAAALIAPGGRFVTCAGGPTSERAVVAGTTAGLVAEASRAVVPRAGKPPLFWLLRFGLRDDVRSSIIEPPLVVRDENGRRTEEFARLREDMGMPR
jgi:tRNA1Val (adenine37-N6)-methyltransferase